ncbi:hypothetical protein BUALT_Bualt09G0021700 [Buddleja alternifolia]|uniref:ribonuclease P n=1 Tax=Buddleja alternifolia TaxID=168488 RepID=A0AAV6WZA7_9LAMI|nr:hypothetical protein BUALT_Bualt09G0021700 [Buddleja alternifolia]
MGPFFTFKPLQQTQLHLSSFSHCKYSPSSLNTFTFDPAAKHTPQQLLQVKVRVVAANSQESRSPRGGITEQLSRNNRDFNSGFSSFTDINKRAGRKRILEKDRAEEPIERKRVILKDRNAKIGLGYNAKRGKEGGSGVSSMRFKGTNLMKNTYKVSEVEDNIMDKRNMKRENNNNNNRVVEKRGKKPKIETPGVTLRVGLDMCSKRGDVMGAIKLYHLAKKEGIKMGQYHYAGLLYLCSSAATGIVQPAKSGSGTRSLSHGEPFMENSVVGTSELFSEVGGEMAKKGYSRGEFCVPNSKGESVIPAEIADSVISNGEEDIRNHINVSMELSSQTLDGLVQSMKKSSNHSNTRDDRGEGYGIQVSEDVKRIALQKGFEIYDEMRTEKVPMNEATFTSVARMAMAFGDGDMAFDMVKQMKEYGINPRLRSYGPALAIFCNNGDVENAFAIEKHMLENSVYPEEPELEALLKVSIEAGKSEKVYYVLHKLRTSVRQVSQATADLIEGWFKSKVASRVGKRKWDEELIIQAMVNGGGGWHGKGWLGKGKWTVHRSLVGSDGLCKCCDEKLVTIDLDPEETDNFAKSVASIAAQREKHSSFQKFQKWLEDYGPFDAVVDAANVGLYSQRGFNPSKVNAVVNGICQMLPSRKWPLIVLHNRRVTGDKMDEPVNKALIDKWKNANALYATPTGSNDDWYWLYAAIKCRGLLVTNDEMRDHLFQLLGNDIFPRWKERHQVHFSFDETGLVFRMPPPCSVVIQESEKGHWHIPIASELENEDERIWLCCTRANSSLTVQDSADVQKESHITQQKKREARIGGGVKSKLGGQDKLEHSEQELEELSSNVKDVELSSVLKNHASILQKIEAAEKLGACLINFQI